jgi:hypothetical protein
MSGVILKCPNCGTAQVTPGECDACHEAEVRYFCTNHMPGIWLQSPACSRCGAQFGRSEPAHRPTASPVPRAASPETIPPRASEPYRRPAAPTRTPGRDLWTRPVPRKSAGDRDDGIPPAREAIGRRWPELLRTASRIGGRPRVPTEEIDEVSPARVAGGCLRQVILIALLFFILSIVASFLMSGALLPILIGILS